MLERASFNIQSDTVFILFYYYYYFFSYTLTRIFQLEVETELDIFYLALYKCAGIYFALHYANGL